LVRYYDLRRIQMRVNYEGQLKELKLSVLKMGALVEEIIDLAVTSLAIQDLEMADLVYKKDDAIDELELEIEKSCMTLIALQQPMARDLRTIGTALKVITDLERMGDNAVNIAKVTKEIGAQPLIKPLIDIPRMAKIAQDMVRRSLDAFVKEDVDLAIQVSEDDDKVDKIYEDIYMEIIELMRADSATIFQGTRLLFVGRYLERIADHTTNVCERIIYMVTGEKVEIN